MIIKDDPELLKTPCADVLPEEVDELVAKLEIELEQSNRDGAPGIGLAAPQIGIFKKAAIIRIGDFKANLINAKIESGTDLFIFKDEGCLSFPGQTGNTIRYNEIVVSNNLVYPHKFVAVGLIAVAIQHEIGHYSQDLFFDHLAPVPAKTAKKKPGPNDKCSCNSGKKFKKCCGKV